MLILRWKIVYPAPEEMDLPVCRDCYARAAGDLRRDARDAALGLRPRSLADLRLWLGAHRRGDLVAADRHTRAILRRQAMPR